MHPLLKDVEHDIRAFADNEDDVIVERDGEILFSRFGREVQCRFHKDADGKLLISTGDRDLPYRTFLSKELARLDILAERILSRRTRPDTFINGPAELESASDPSKSDKSLNLLMEICNNPLPFTTRVIFVTADAGQGKTVLLRQMQYLQAEKFSANQSSFLFWHVDLQGRQLLRLNEALFGDLGELRVSGLYMQSIITLLRYGLLVLAIDGFDELAAEQGSNDALGAISHFVKMLGESGTIITASRRTFFDAEEYVKRTRLLSASVSSDSQYDQLHLKDWTKDEDIEYLEKITTDEKKFDNPDRIYKEILRQLNDDPSHPMLAKPFLLAQIARGLLRYDLSPAEFVGKMKNPLEGVASVIEAFIEREVTQKWKMRETGEPYLSQSQHITFLSLVAEEMWRSQKERIRLEFIEDTLAILMDDWHIPQDNRRQIIDMVKMHVLLIPGDGNYVYRKFEHPEFKNYFISCHFKEILDKGAICLRFLATAQLPDSVAKYMASMLPKEPSYIERIIQNLEEMVNSERRPTYLQTNVGTIIPYLMSDTEFESVVTFDAKVVFSSIVFEHTKIQNVTIRNGQFVNASFLGVEWKNVRFESCEFNEAGFDYDAKITDVMFRDCQFDGIILCKNGEELSRVYSPQLIVDTLADMGFTFYDVKSRSVDPFDESREKKMLIKFLNTFRKRTRVTGNVLNMKFLGGQYNFVTETLIPLAEKYDIIEEIQWEGRRKDRVWQLRIRIEDILKGQEADDKSKLASFWKRMRKIAKKH